MRRVRNNFDVSLLAGAAFLGAIVPAQAQTGASDAAAQTAQISDIIVTAQRREERAQDVPIVISAFSPERIRELNITEPQKLYGNVPSLVVGTQGQASRDVQSFSIRGQSTGFLALPSVATYFNEVPLIASISLSLQGGPGQFVDLENVQVLSGPQGTLFGRNTTGGAVLLSAHKPSTDRVEGYVQGSYGNYDLVNIEGALNVPLIEDKLAVRVAGAYYDRTGYTQDIVWDKDRDNQHWYTGRVSILATPTERLSNNLMVYGSKSRNNGAGYINRGFRLGLRRMPGAPDIPGGLVTGGCMVPDPCAAIYNRQTEISQQIGPRKTRNDVDGYSNIDAWGAINTTDLELTDELKLRNIVSYQKLKSEYGNDNDGTPLQAYQTSQSANFPNFPVAGLTDEFGIPAAGYNNEVKLAHPRDHLEQITEELQLQGNMLDNHLTYTVGGFYIDTKPAGLWESAAVQFCSPTNTGNPVTCAGTRGRSGVTNKSKALYGQGTLDFGAFSPALKNLRFTGGYRYTWDTVKGFSASWSPLPNGTVRCSLDNSTSSNPEDCRFDATLKTKAPTWTVGLDYKPVEGLMVYGKVTRGYKAGGFNSVAVNDQFRTFEPEKLTSYEAGFKSDWRVGSVPGRLNVTYFYSDYKNIQRPGSDFNQTTFAGGAKILSATATIQGVEAEASIRPFEGLEIGGTFSHTDADYKKYQFTSLGADRTCLPGGGFAVVPFGGTVDASCIPFQFVTPYIYNIRATAKLPMGEDMGELSYLISYSHFSKQHTSPTGDPSFEPGSTLEPYGLLNMSLDWRNIRQTGLDASLFVTNATNKLYRVANANSYNGLGIFASLYGEPRMYGIKLRYSFGNN
ncbi:TonB-dependent receptor [Sphingobium agri]|uniref:TonB-dependent receptor n=1 Tax=Sphingobium agri TaxID=2933566 RepID=A0ABT0DZM0_9SPHN|nr:TonB-dependent receptor [Sphingobium agri]MCK0532561.1 TonB-dependent receptor [Sphingobium agri]